MDLKKVLCLKDRGRVGRFMEHFKGRVFIFDKEFYQRINENGDLLRHKLFDKKVEKQDVDLIFIEQVYMTENQKFRFEYLESLKESSAMPLSCFN